MHMKCFRREADATPGWDEGVLSTDGGMTLGEKATLTITGYDSRSLIFPEARG